MTLSEFLASKNYPTDLPCNGQLHRFDHHGTNTGWFVAHKIPLSTGKKILLAFFGDWKTGEKHEFESEEEYNEYEQKEITQAKSRVYEQMAAQRAGEHDATASRCSKHWDGLTETTRHPYLQSKGLEGSWGTRYGDLPLTETKQIKDCLIVPIRDVHGKLWSLQGITNEGQKYLVSGGRVRGCFYQLNWDGFSTGTILVCEGAATGISLAMAVQHPVACAMFAGNLSSVALALREKYPTHEIIICGDDDRFTVVNGIPTNAGRTKAVEAAKACKGTYRFPVFKSDEGQPTDYDDLRQREGIDTVRGQLTSNPLEKASPVSVEDENAPLPPVVLDKNGKPKLPPEKLVVDSLIRHFGKNIIKQERDLFLYTGTYWKHCDIGEVDRIKTHIQTMYRNLADSKKLESTFRMFLLYVPHVPEGIDMFTPRPFCTNFTNGTLHAIRGTGHEYKMEFHPHRMEDYIVNILPYEYRENDTTCNPMFEEMLNRIFKDNKDKEQKIRAIRQMFGACLFPTFPHLFFLHGKPKTGKSTVMLIANRLVHKDNLCGVEPSEFKDFNMESMLGKLVNMDTDVDVSSPIRDSVVKKVIDRQPMRIRRKGVRDIYAPLPPIHIFGGNGIPRTLEGTSRAMDRRWTFIEFTSFQPEGQYDKEYHDLVFNHSPQGILNFAIEGIKDLLSSKGHYLNPDSGKATMEEWQMESDPIGQFLEDISFGEVVVGNAKILAGEKLLIRSSKLLDIFMEWQNKNVVGNRHRIGRNTFYSVLEQKGIAYYRTQHGRFIKGIGVEGEDEACKSVMPF